MHDVSRAQHDAENERRVALVAAVHWGRKLEQQLQKQQQEHVQQQQALLQMSQRLNPHLLRSGHSSWDYCSRGYEYFSDLQRSGKNQQN